MLEYLGVILVVGWLWARSGRAPRRLTVVGSVLAVLGLALVLDLLGSAHLDFVGVLWGMGAAVGLAVYFVVSASEQDALPPAAMAGLGMGVGAVVLALFGLVGVLPLRAGVSSVVLGGARLPWFVPMAGLAVIAAALAYAVGVTAARLLGATLASFIGLTEVLFAVVFAWLLLDQLPGPIQIAGGALIIGGVSLVRVDELRRDRPTVQAVDVYSR
jgi:drug/metabolite transporter (DMT)-like permease